MQVTPTDKQIFGKEGAARILVLGASGRLGQLFRQRFQSRQCELAVLKVQWQARTRVPLNDADPADVLVWDFLRDDVPNDVRADIVLCLAGAVPDRNVDLALNSILAERALSIGTAIKAKYIFLVSSVAVYGSGPFSETEKVAPITPYGMAKAEMEKLAAKWIANTGKDAPRVTILRVGNVAGADALLGPGKRHVALETGPDGEDIKRSYIGPARLADIVFALCKKAADGEPLPSILNIALSPSVSFRALLDAAGWSYSRIPAAGNMPLDVDVDTHLLEQLGFTPRENACAEDIWADIDAFMRPDETS